MSKPKPIEYIVRWWGITYQAQYFDASQATGECHYEARISYIAKPNDKSMSSITHEDRKIFTTFEKAKKWIDGELKP